MAAREGKRILSGVDTAVGMLDNNGNSNFVNGLDIEDILESDFSGVGINSV